MPPPKLSRRAHLARKMVTLNQNTSSPLRDGIVDALTDIRHLCREYEIDFTLADKMAHQHFLTEVLT